MISFVGLHDTDLRRGPGGRASHGEIEAHVEAELIIADGDRTIFREREFEVVTLAGELARWSAFPAPARQDFLHSPDSFTDPEVIRINHHGDGWRIGSVYAPGIWTREVIDRCRDELGLDVADLVHCADVCPGERA